MYDPAIVLVGWKGLSFSWSNYDIQDVVSLLYAGIFTCWARLNLKSETFCVELVGVIHGQQYWMQLIECCRWVL